VATKNAWPEPRSSRPTVWDSAAFHRRRRFRLETARQRTAAPGVRAVGPGLIAGAFWYCAKRAGCANRAVWLSNRLGRRRGPGVGAAPRSRRILEGPPAQDRRNPVPSPPVGPADQHAAYAPSSDTWCVEEPGRDCLPRTCADNDVTVAVFGAEWCLVQKAGRRHAQDPRVVAKLRNFGKVHVDTTKPGTGRPTRDPGDPGRDILRPQRQGDRPFRRYVAPMISSRCSMWSRKPWSR